ncbi:hypothetical protein ACIBF1_18595 [Spirillospora sp. NPDC050679]
MRQDPEAAVDRAAERLAALEPVLKRRGYGIVLKPDSLVAFPSDPRSAGVTVVCVPRPTDTDRLWFRLDGDPTGWLGRAEHDAFLPDAAHAIHEWVIEHLCITPSDHLKLLAAVLARSPHSIRTRPLSGTAHGQRLRVYGRLGTRGRNLTVTCVRDPDNQRRPRFSHDWADRPPFATHDVAAVAEVVIGFATGAGS